MVVGEFTQETQLVVIGGGPGGYAAAFRAAELGVETVIVDPRETLGGVCLHEGCIPSKTLLHIVETINQASRAKEFGVQFAEPKFDLDAIRQWVQQSIDSLAKGLQQLCKRHGVEHIQGHASFEDGRRLAVRDSAIPRIRFRRAIIATGATPCTHDVLAIDGTHVLSPKQAIKLPHVPKSLLIVGSNYNAVELAMIYTAFGSRVTLVDASDRLLPQVDADLVRPVARRLDAILEQVSMKTTITQAAIKDDMLQITLHQGETSSDHRFEQAIVSLGYKPNIDELQLQGTSVKLDEHGFIQTDDQQRTSDARIFAVGDVTGGAMLADRALTQGRVAAEVIAGWNSHLDTRAVPYAVFSDPQIAWCGLTEQQAKAEAIPYAVAKQPWGASGKAVGMGRVDGMSKILYDPDTQLVLGIGICGPHATEMIAQGSLAIEMGAVITDLAATVHPHPTLSEMIANAAQRVDERIEGAAQP
jgi:dihydrolipoamide dehydrogenase